MLEVRCSGCAALLLRAARSAISGPVEIKCRRCGTIKNLGAIAPGGERPRAPDDGGARDDEGTSEAAG